ncbi:MAG TPA: HAD-IB family hydrolase [Luteimonas sp.]|nr:HAD-IB family hydrolase [Luteimonas sp.]
MDLALFDFDGTITTHEAMPAFVRATTSRPRLVAGYLLLWPMILGYKLGMVSGSRVRAAIVRVAYTGRPAAWLQARGADFARDDLERHLRPEAMRRIEWHRARGDAVLVVSGGLAEYLQPWADAHGLEVACSRLGRRGDRLTGRYEGAQCVGADKARRVAARFDLTDFARIHAYGDTAEDEHLLAMATDRFYRTMPEPAA